MAKGKISLDDVISTAEAGAELGITATRVLVLIKEGRLPATRFGKSWAIRRADLDLVRIRTPGRKPKNPDEKKPDTKKKRP